MLIDVRCARRRLNRNSPQRGGSGRQCAPRARASAGARLEVRTALRDRRRARSGRHAARDGHDGDVADAGEGARRAAGASGFPHKVAPPAVLQAACAPATRVHPCDGSSCAVGVRST